jgi:hypothetical protein
MNHAAGHWDRVPENFLGNPELFERVNAAGREREIDRASADEIALARIGPAFVKFHFVSATAQVRGEQSAREAATDENEPWHGGRISESGKKEKISEADL